MPDQNQLPQSSVSNPSNQPGGSNNQPGGNTSQPGVAGNQFQLNQQGQRQAGTGFTNINKLLGAGQGAGQQMGQSVQSGIGQQAGQFQQGLNQAQSDFNTGLQQNSYNTDANSQAATNAINKIVTPGQSSGNAANAQQFQQYLSGGYQGPQGLQNTQQLGSQVQNLQGLGNATQTAAGQQGLLQQFVGKGQYTGGQQALDSLLLGQGGGQQALQQARATTIGAGNQLNQAQTAAQLQAQQAATGNQAFAQNLMGQLQDAINPIDTAANQAAQQATTANQAAQAKNQQLSTTLQGIFGGVSPTDANAQASALNKAISTGVLSQDQLTAMGIDPNSYAGNLNVGNLASAIGTAAQANPNVTAAQALTSQQAAQLQALQQLGGTKAQMPSDISQAQIQAAQASGYTNPTYNPLSGIGSNQALYGNNVTRDQQSTIQNRLNTNQQQLANYQQQLATLTAQSQNPANNAGVLSNSTDTARQAQALQHNIDLLNTQNTADQSALSSPQFQTIQQMLQQAQSGGPLTAIRGPAGTVGGQTQGNTIPLGGGVIR